MSGKMFNLLRELTAKTKPADEAPITEGVGTAAAERLEEIREEMMELCREALRLTRVESHHSMVYERARSYWYGHIMSALGSEEYPKGHATTMESSVRELYAIDDEGLDESLTESSWDHPAYEKLWSKLVPSEGEAETEYGEAVRCLSNLEHDFYNNGYGNAVDVRIDIETEQEFDDTVSTVVDYVEALLGDGTIPDRYRRKVNELIHELHDVNNENSGSIRDEDDLDDLSSKAANALSQLQNLLGSTDGVTDEEGYYKTVTTQYSGTIDGDDFESAMRELEEMLSNVYDYVKVRVTSEPTHYDTEEWQTISNFARSSNAPRNVMLAINAIRPHVNWTKDTASSDEYSGFTHLIKDWLVSLYESLEVDGEPLVEGRERVTTGELERAVGVIIGEDDASERLCNVIEEEYGAHHGLKAGRLTLDGGDVKRLLKKADLDHIEEGVLSMLKLTAKTAVAEAKEVTGRDLERVVLELLDEDDEDGQYRLEDALEQWVDENGGGEGGVYSCSLNASAIQTVLDEADLNNLTREVLRRLSL